MIDTPEHDPAWRQATAAEEAEMRLYALNCEGLSDAALEQVKADFVAAGLEALRQLAVRLQRVPTQAEADSIRADLAAHFNLNVLPPMRAHAAGSIH